MAASSDAGWTGSSTSINTETRGMAQRISKTKVETHKSAPAEGVTRRGDILWGPGPIIFCDAAKPAARG